MSSEFVVGLAAIVMLTLISIAITIQNVEKNRKEKRRLENALNSRARNFEGMLSGLPQGFLNNDLKQLVCICLTEVYEQLQLLNPKQNLQAAALKRTKATADELKNSAKANTPIPDLNNQEQIKEVQQQLTSLFNFIAKLRANNRINDDQAQHHALQIRRLMLKTNLDLLNEHARLATHSGKLKLAVHHYQTAVDKIKKENEADFFSNHLLGYAERIEDLEEQIGEREQQQQAAIDKNQGAWDEALQEKEEPWKKNSVYD
jgi:hypothetical protein